jgi:hypothetical protein
LISALARPERAVAHFLKRLCRGLFLSRLIAAAPAAESARDLHALEPCPIDTS